MLEMNRSVAKVLIAMATVGAIVTTLFGAAVLTGIGYLLFRGVATVLGL